MVLKKSKKTKGSSCQRILGKLRVMLSKSKWYQTLPNPFPCSCRNRMQDFVFYKGVVSGLADMDKKGLIPPEEFLNAYNENFMNFLNESPLKKVKNQDQSLQKVPKRVNIQITWHREYPYSEPIHCASFQLAEKMRKLEMMDTEDLEHVLDVEEVLHYYSRLNTPVYYDIVDNFFTHICSDIYSSQSSVRDSKREESDWSQ